MSAKQRRSVKLPAAILDALEARWSEIAQHPTVALLAVGDSLSSKVHAALYLFLESKPARRRKAAEADAGCTSGTEATTKPEPTSDALPDLEPERLAKVVQARRDGMPAEELARHMNEAPNCPAPPGGWTGPKVERLVNGHAGT